MYDVFISYCSKNTKEALEVEEALRYYGLTTWIANAYNILGGENFQEKIVSALKESRLFLLILTQESADSKWVKLEVTQALKLNMKIYTLQIKETELDDLWTFKLGCSQITNGIENFEAALESIAISIKKERDRILLNIKDYYLNFKLLRQYKSNMLPPFILFVISLLAVILFAFMLKLEAGNDVPGFDYAIMSILTPAPLIGAILQLIAFIYLFKDAKAGNPSAHYIISLIENFLFMKKRAKKHLEFALDKNYEPAVKYAIKQNKENPDYVIVLKEKLDSKYKNSFHPYILISSILTYFVSSYSLLIFIIFLLL